MAISAADVKKLRDQTGLGMMQCKRALEESNGDFPKAVECLRKQGLETVASKASRTPREGRIGSYVHSNNKIGVVLELNCETDFVANSEEFKQLVKDLCMQVAATAPMVVARKDVPADLVEKEKDIYRAQYKDKPEQVREKIVEGKLGSFYQRVCLMDQPFIKNPPEMSITQLIEASIAKFKENIQVRRFTRFELGKDEE